jgi:hypothetical protein
LPLGDRFENLLSVFKKHGIALQLTEGQQVLQRVLRSVCQIFIMEQMNAVRH